MAIVIWPDTTGGFANPMLVPMVFDAQVDFLNPVFFESDINITTNTGGGGGSSDPSLANYTTYSPDVTLESGEAVTITVDRAWWWRIGNIVRVSVYLKLHQGTITANSGQILNIPLPVAANTPYGNYVIGNVTANSGYRETNCYMSVEGNPTTTNSAELSIYHTVSGTDYYQYIAVSFEYVVNV